MVSTQALRLARLFAGRVMCDCQWRDIETAPKDGTTIHIANAKSRAMTLALYCPRKERWLCRLWDEDLPEVSNSALWWSPTHWQPLPAPPEPAPQP